MLVNVLNELNEQQSLPSSSPVPHWLYIADSPFTLHSTNVLFSSLTHTFNIITRLTLWACNVDDKCVECLCRYLPDTKLTFLDLQFNNITNNGVLYLVNTKHKLEELWLIDNEITDVEHVSELFRVNHPNLKWYIW